MKTIKVEVIVIGGGLAGLRAAAAAAEKGSKVMLITDGPSSSPEIMGINAAVSADDSAEIYFQDLEKSGSSINDPAIGRIMVERIPEELRYLESIGAHFDKNEDGSYNTIQSLGASRARLVHYKSRSGAMAMKVLRERCLALSVLFRERTTALDLLVSDGAVRGVLVYDRASRSIAACLAGAVVIAAGGYGAIQKSSTYPENIYGSGYAMAFRAGADLIDMEFQQYEPCTYIFPEQIRGKVIATTLLRKGGILQNSLGEEFMPHYGLTRESAQKGPLSRAICSEIRAGRGTEHGGVLYDVSMLSDKFLFEDSLIFTKPALDAGIDLKTDMVEVAPSGHTSLGGIRVNTECLSAVRNLYACGEAMGGVHGANRIGGNAGTETLVFGAIAGANAAKAASLCRGEAELSAQDRESILEREALFRGRKGSEDCGQIIRELRECAGQHIGIFRTETGLRKAGEKIKELENRLREAEIREITDALRYHSAASMLLIAEIQRKASLMREESRGVFFREDFPFQDDAHWAKNIIVSNKDNSTALTAGICR